jgi:hypothetical protein
VSELDPVTVGKVFAAARSATFRATNLGQMTEVSVDGFHYRVLVGPYDLAHTDCRSGPGGTEWTFASATPEQDRALRRAIAVRTATLDAPAPFRASSTHRHR